MQSFYSFQDIVNFRRTENGLRTEDTEDTFGNK